ncbi:hypothetical protein A1U5_04882 [Escherichia coli KTE66]|nr:hypothetical protein A1U5_04882 [Escherichia coli KTE66]
MQSDFDRIFEIDDICRYDPSIKHGLKMRQNVMCE